MVISGRSSPTPVDLPGLDPAAASAWLLEHVQELRAPVRFELISGGRSNLTFGVVDAAGRRVVLRRPPIGAVLESAHDMGREHRIITALSSTAVPVPTPRGLCDDPSVIGAPFYVMDHVEGAILRDAATATLLPESLRKTVSHRLVDTLVDLHTLEPVAVGLGTLGRRDAYVERQLRRWNRQWEAVATRDLPVVTEVFVRLQEWIPTQARTSIVHGDYRLDNVVLAAGGSVAAVLDWELCTLGDPLADLGMLLAYWIEPGESAEHMLTGVPTTAPGFAGRREVLARYAERTGADVSQIGYYVALALWKLACIGEGIYARYRAGAMGAREEAYAEQVAGQVELLAHRARAVLDADDSLTAIAASRRGEGNESGDDAAP